MVGWRGYSRLVMVTAAVGGALACADTLAPNRSPDVLAGAGGVPARDSTPSAASDTTLPPNRLRGMVIATSPDSTTPWRPVESVRLEVAQREAGTGEMKVIATVMSDAAGRFVFDRLDVPTGLLFLRAVPPLTTPYRASRWLAAYAFVGPWVRIGKAVPGEPGAKSWTLGPYVVLERATTPRTEYVAPLLIAHVYAGDDDAPVAGARIVIDRTVVMGRDTVLAGIVASGRTDANGFALITLPGPGLYLERLTMPADSPYRDFTGGVLLPAVADPETTRLAVWDFIAGRR
jgi:hypothetical protein